MYLKLHFHVSPRNVDFTDTEKFLISIKFRYFKIRNIFFGTWCQALLDKAQITRITNLLVSKSRVYVYGRGSSGLVAQEMKLRFMRIGLNIEAVTDSSHPE